VNVVDVVREYIQDEQLLEPGGTVVVGVSGGADSQCLLHVLHRLCTDFEWSLHVAHLNHSLRGAAADQDARAVKSLALQWGLPCTVGLVDVKKAKREQRLSLEEAARQARYDFLAGVARQVNATAVAVGHNADDQSETVLMHFLRGTGVAGLRGMLSATDLYMLGSKMDWSRDGDPAIRLVRPLLTVPRTDIEAYCEEHQLSPRFDTSNLDTTYFRNRLRHELFPVLETFNPNVKAALRRTASVVAADYELLGDVQAETWQRVVCEENETSIKFDLVSWRELPLALRRETLRRAIFRLRPGLCDIAFVHIRQAIQVAADGGTGARAALPDGLELHVGYQRLEVCSMDAVPDPPPWPLLWRRDPVPVVVPGATTLPAARRHAGAPQWRLEAEVWRGDRDTITTNPDPWTAYVDADKLGSDLALRQRRPSDRFQPLGMGGDETKVAAFMVNAKIPRRWRGHLPLLVHNIRGAEEIAWIAGWRIDERIKVTGDTRHVLRLRWLATEHAAPGTGG
jgi:tRNA(Ile)-lysidine synthase